LGVDRAARVVRTRTLSKILAMEGMKALISAWWVIGLGIIGAVVMVTLLWRWALADLVLSSFELP